MEISVKKFSFQNRAVGRRGFLLFSLITFTIISPPPSRHPRPSYSVLDIYVYMLLYSFSTLWHVFAKCALALNDLSAFNLARVVTNTPFSR